MRDMAHSASQNFESPKLRSPLHSFALPSCLACSAAWDRHQTGRRPLSVLCFRESFHNLPSSLMACCSRPQDGEIETVQAETILETSKIDVQLPEGSGWRDGGGEGDHSTLHAFHPCPSHGELSDPVVPSGEAGFPDFKELSKHVRLWLAPYSP